MGEDVREDQVHIVGVLQDELVEHIQGELGEIDGFGGGLLEQRLLVLGDVLGDAAGQPQHGMAALPAASAIRPRSLRRMAMTFLPVSTPTLPMTPSMLRSPAGAAGPTTKSGPPRK